MFLLNAKMM